MVRGTPGRSRLPGFVGRARSVDSGHRGDRGANRGGADQWPATFHQLRGYSCAGDSRELVRWAGRRNGAGASPVRGCEPGWQIADYLPTFGGPTAGFLQSQAVAQPQLHFYVARAAIPVWIWAELRQL